jgi:hypothetical protein
MVDVNVFKLWSFPNFSGDSVIPERDLLENWNDGLLKWWKMGKWNVGILEYWNSGYQKRKK